MKYTGNIMMNTGPLSKEETDKYNNEPEFDGNGNCLHPERLIVSRTAGECFIECQGCKSWKSDYSNGWRTIGV
jgi:hypothetical protein